MLNYSVLPINLQGGMKRYIEDGIRPGSFLTACLENDFVGALGVASNKTYDYLHGVGMFLWNELPARGYPNCPWGNRKAVVDWIGHKGHRGLEADSERQGALPGDRGPQD